MVDDVDFEWLSKFKWQANVRRCTVYAASSVGTMHRMIMGVSDRATYVDHADGNGLNNTRQNLRLCTHQQNLFNMGGNANTSSVFKGVSWSVARGMWVSQIVVGGKNKNIGSFKNEKDAARAYNQFAKDHHGEYARLNDVDPPFPKIEWKPKVLLATNSSGFRGVSFHKSKDKWRSYIVFRRKQIFLGYFIDPSDAARRYDLEAVRIFGDAARLNFPQL